MMPRAPDNIFGAAIILQHTEQRDGVNVDGGGKNAAGVHGGEGWGIEYDRWMIFSDLYTKQSRC